MAHAGQAASPQGWRNTRGWPAQVEHPVSRWLHDLNWKHIYFKATLHPLLEVSSINRFALILFQSALQRVNSDSETALKIQPWGGQRHSSHSAPGNPRDMGPYCSVSSSKLYLCKLNWTLAQGLCWILYAPNPTIQGPVSLRTFRCFPSNRA